MPNDYDAPVEPKPSIAQQITELIQNNHLVEAKLLAEQWVASANQEPLLALQYAGMTQLYCGDAMAAEKSFRSALEIAPHLPRNMANLGITFMLQGNFQAGLPLYEARYAAQLHSNEKVSFANWDSNRQWRGESLLGKHLVLVGEQGYGDHFHFIRFAAELHALGAAYIAIHARPELINILSSAPHVDAVVSTPPEDDAFDFWCPLLSIPLWLQLRQPQPPINLPYLSVNENRAHIWQQEICRWAPNKYKIGIVWAGSPGNSIDSRRSLSTEQMLTLVKDCKFATFFSLQLGNAGMDSLVDQCSHGMIPLLDLITDFSETAAAILSMDLVISVDTAVAHLAGALGKPTWLLLPAGPDWRWGQHQNNTAWYPSMRIFRQSTPGDWSSVLKNVAKELNLSTL